MIPEEEFAVIEISELKWPRAIPVPSSRFRLLVAADTSALTSSMISDFAKAALSAGMVYFCAWGDGCERFHDIMDEIVVEDDLGQRRFAGPTPDDTIMTTWHSNDTLEEALDFLATCAYPTDGFSTNSNFRLVICVDNKEWAATARGFLKSADFFV